MNPKADEPYLPCPNCGHNVHGLKAEAPKAKPEPKAEVSHEVSSVLDDLKATFRAKKK